MSIWSSGFYIETILWLWLSKTVASKQYFANVREFQPWSIQSVQSLYRSKCQHPVSGTSPLPPNWFPIKPAMRSAEIALLMVATNHILTLTFDLWWPLQLHQEILKDSLWQCIKIAFNTHIFSPRMVYVWQSNLNSSICNIYWIKLSNIRFAWNKYT